MALIDSHCHLEPKAFTDVDAVIERAKAVGLVHAMVIGQFHAPGDFGAALEVARRRPDFLSATMGIHPHEAARATPQDLALLESLCALPDVKAVGEAGLDYYYEHSPKETQREVFRFQCQLSKRLKKPLVVHVRDAHEECQGILKEEGVSHGVIHCFTGDVVAARAYLELGLHISLSGIVTYKKTEALQEAVREIPLSRLLIETDSPYLAPVPLRGKPNEPSYVQHTALKVAELKNVSVEGLGKATSENAIRLFGLSAALLKNEGLS